MANKDKAIHKTPRVYIHSGMKQIKVVDRYNNVLAFRQLKEEPEITFHPRARNMRNVRLGKVVIPFNIARGHSKVVFRWIKDEEVDKWVKAVSPK